jgi:hypothetical protein
VLTKSAALNYFITLAIQFIWSKLNDLSFLTINTMISMSVPGIAQNIQLVLLNLVYFDILFTEDWFPQFMEYLHFDLNFEDQPLNSYFAENGFQYKNVFKNLGSTLFFIILYVLSWFFLIVLKMLSSFSTLINKL